MAEQAAVGSWQEEDFTEGGFFDDKDATITAAQVVIFDFKGKAEPACCLLVTYKPDDGETDDDDRTEYYRIGSAEAFAPNSDGSQYVATGSKRSMNKNAKAALWLRALKAAGFQLSTLAAGVGTALSGLHVHLNQTPLPTFVGRDGTEVKDKTILIVTKILDSPTPEARKAAAGSAAKQPPARNKAAKAESAAAGAATAATATTAAAGAAGVAAEADTILSGVVLELLASHGGKLAKTMIPTAVFAKVTDPAQRTACMKLLANPAWLGAGADVRGWSVEGGELSL